MGARGKAHGPDDFKAWYDSHGMTQDRWPGAAAGMFFFRAAPVCLYAAAAAVALALVLHAAGASVLSAAGLPGPDVLPPWASFLDPGAASGTAPSPSVSEPSVSEPSAPVTAATPPSSGNVLEVPSEAPHGASNVLNEIGGTDAASPLDITSSSGASDVLNGIDPAPDTSAVSGTAGGGGVPSLRIPTVPEVGGALLAGYDLCLAATWASVLCSLACVAGYGAAAVVRWRAYERDVLASDRSAEHIRASIVRNMGFGRELREIRKAMRRKGEKDGTPSDDEEQRRIGAECLVRVRVSVHVRQASDGDEIERTTVVRVEIPPQEKALKYVRSKTEDLETFLSRSFGADDAPFSSAVHSKDSRWMSWTSSYIVPDRYAYEVVEEVETGPESQYSLPFSVFNDRTAAVLAATEGAKRWGNEAADSVDALLVTKDEGAKRSKLTVGATSIQVSYDNVLRFDGGHTDSINGSLRQMFDDPGCTVSVRGSRMEVVVPLPNRLRKPIDIPTIYREAFGEEAPLEEQPYA